MRLKFYLWAIGLVLFLYKCSVPTIPEQQIARDMPPFHQWFQVLEQDTLMVYSEGAASNFRGEALTEMQKDTLLSLFQDSTLLRQFIHIPSGAPVPHFDWYATYHFSLLNNRIAYIVRTETDYVHSNGIYILFYDVKRKTITNYYELANRYSIGGNDGFKRSWLLDLDGDGHREVLTVQEKQQRYYDESDDLDSDEEWFVVDDSLWITLQHWEASAWSNAATYQSFTKGVFAETATDYESQSDSFFLTNYANSVEIMREKDLIRMFKTLEATSY